MATRFYGTMWRWHFLAGLIACPLLAMVALTGTLYAFAPEFELALDREVRTATDTGGPRRLDASAAAARMIVPPCEPTGITVHADRGRTVEVWCEDDRMAYVDPYRAEVKGTRRSGNWFLAAVFEIHTELMAGDTGGLVIEWATSIAVWLLFSGAYLWWPRGRTGGRFRPRAGMTGRLRLRDLHAVAGLYALPIVLASAATGLSMTQLAGEERWNRLLESRPPAPRSTPQPGANRIGFDAAVAAAGVSESEYDLSIPLPSAPDAAYSVRVGPADQGTPSATHRRYIDAYSGQLLRTLGWKDRSAFSKVDASAYAIHVGTILGWPGRIAVVLGALTLTFLCVTGPWMWWIRRPAGRLGIPPPAQRMRWPLVVGVAVLGWMLPALGWTLVAIAVLELIAWVVRRVRAVVA